MLNILLTEKIHKDGIAFLKQHAEVTIAESTAPEVLKEQIKGKDALLIRSTPLTKEVVDAGDKLRCVGRHGIGVDNLDIPYLSEKGIAVINTPFANVNSVAEHVVAMMMALSKKLLACDRDMRAGVFSKTGASLPGMCQNMGYGGFELSGKTLGLIGCGKIGLSTLKKCLFGFEMAGVIFDPMARDKGLALPEGARWAEDLDDLLKNADYVSLHVPYLESTKNMIGKRELALMKKSAYLINCARGGIVDEEALYHALSSGEIAGAALDVFMPEPPVKDDKLFTLPNILLTPHAAAMTDESLSRMAIELCTGVLEVLAGKEPYNFFNKDALKGKG